MRSRSFTALTLLVLAAAPLAGQAVHKDHDPDQKAAGGKLPAGWSGRTDKADARLEDAKFVAMGPGYHVTSGPAAIYWKDKVSGPFTASATFTQTKAPAHPEAYGLFFMGNNLQGADQSYAYFIVRGDGKFMVRHRASNGDLHTIMPWTESPAVRKADANGKATNTLTIDASKPDSVRLSVNGTQVAALPGAHIGNTDGAVGLRVNHNLDVHVSDLSVTKSTAAAPSAGTKSQKKG